MIRKSQVCTRCVMDTSAADIAFDEQGVCNYCSEFLHHSESFVLKDPTWKTQELEFLIKKIKTDGKGKRYDCIVGISGGVDSSWVLVQAVNLGLRPLAVHMDNGWNSELAQNNIANLVRSLKVDLFTYVIDWEEYRRLMQSFFDADVVDIELLYDNALHGVNYRQAKKYKVKYIIGGTNNATEGLKIPEGWNWNKFDKGNIKSINKKFGNIEIKSYPLFGIFDYFYYEKIRKIKWYGFLDYFDYNKKEVLDVLQKDFGYKPYPYKHYESIFTRFYQGYILPSKFGIDKRKMHLSSLIMSNQMTRKEALLQMQNIPYLYQNDLDNDIEYFLKKMGWTKLQLEDYLKRPEVKHSEYPSYNCLIRKLIPIRRYLIKNKRFKIF